MSGQWTKRQQNHCRDCGYGWYPRGKDRAANCPRCGSPEVDLEFEGCLRAIGYLIALPFVVVLFLLQTVFVVATVLVDATIAVLWAVLRVLGKLLGIAAVGGVHTARWSAQTAAPVAGWAGQQWRPMMIWTGEKARQSARHALTAAVFVGRWIASTKDDFLGDAGRDVNPVSLAAKLLTIAVAAIAVGVLMVKAIQAVVHSN